MKQTTPLPTDYRLWLDTLKRTIRSAQIKAALSVNQELIRLYWNLGKMIDEKIQNAQWGEGIIKYIASDLKAEFPNGRNLDCGASHCAERRRPYFNRS